MKNFRNPNLYKLEQGTFETFVENILETNTEYNRTGRLRSGVIEEEEEFDSFDSIGGWEDGDLGGFDDFDFGGGLSNTQPDDQLMSPHEYSEEDIGTLNMMLTAPLYAIRQTSSALINTKRINPKTRKMVAHDWRYWGLGLGAFSLLSLTPFVTSFIYFPVGLALIGSAAYADYYYGEKGGHSYIRELINGDEEDFEGVEEDTDTTEEGIDTTEEGDSGGLFGGSDFGGFDDFGGFGDIDEGGSLSDRYADFEDDEDEGDVGDDYYDPETMGELATTYFPESPIDTSTSESFREGLIDVFKSGINSKGKMIHDRQEMIKYYAKYMPNNDDAFARWTEIREHSPEYDNIAYTIYKSLTSINGKFDINNAVQNDDKMVVMDMRRTPLIYKITVKLPSYFKVNSVTRNANIFNDMLKASDDDEQVGTILTTYGGDLVIKFLRLDYKKIVAMGDLLRLNDEDKEVSFAEEFATSKGIPMVAGMRDNEYPYMVDIVGNPAATIVGGSGSGKSWLTFQFMDSMLISNNPEHLNFIILDAKDAAIWKQFALAPHVLGYHSDYRQFYDILHEVNAEHERRMNELSRMGIESWKDYSERCKREGDNEKLAEMPLLFVIIDEITFSMSALQNEDDEEYKKLKSMLTQLSSVIRASGIRLMLIGQRAIDTSIPKGYMANSPLKLAMKMNVQSDFTTMLGKGYDREVSRIPSGPGEGIMNSEGQSRPSYVKTVIPGGKSDGDILMQVRVMALDWVRRTQDSKYDYTTIFSGMKTTIERGFNRNQYYNQALSAIEKGLITDPVTPDESYLIDTNNPNADVINTAMANVESKLEESAPEPDLEEVDLDEEIDFGEEIDWDNLLGDSLEEEPILTQEELMSEEVNEPNLIQEEPELESEPTIDFDFGGLEDDLYEESYDEPYEEPYDEPYDEPYEESYEETSEEPELEESIDLEEFDFGDLDEDEPVTEEPVTETGLGSLESILEADNNNNKEQAKESDIANMLDRLTEHESEEASIRQEQEELDKLRREQERMLANLQRQKEESLRREEAERKEKEEALRREAERKEQEEARKRLAEEREALERQKEEILRLQQELEQQQQSNTRNQQSIIPNVRVDKPAETHTVNDEQEESLRREEAERKAQEEAKRKAQEETLRREEADRKKQEEAKRKAQEEAKRKAQEESKRKAQEEAIRREEAERKKQEESLRREEAESKAQEESKRKAQEESKVSDHTEIEDMSVAQYVAKYGERVDGERRVGRDVIQAKFNKRRVHIAIMVGEVYEEGGYIYYVR